ncbi:MAG: methyltransferase domain-containing protein [Anaerolineaceae bacterium]|nr:methyltransferase domain-containing protein [Anaerolineaceae bacterium]
MTATHSDKAALRGEPSYVWRAGQQRRLQMILEAAGERSQGKIFENGCGLGSYMYRLTTSENYTVGLDVEFERTLEAHQQNERILCGVGEHLPFENDFFDLILSNEVIEHVQSDKQAVQEIVRTLKPGGRLVLFCPNRGYGFETHGIFWHGEYHFGNIPFVNYLPRKLRDKLAPHVNVYTRRDLNRLFAGLPVKIITRRTIFGAYDNIIQRKPALGKILRAVLQFFEKTPLQVLGLSHFWVVEKI